MDSKLRCYSKPGGRRWRKNPARSLSSLSGRPDGHKHVDRLYALAKLQVRRRNRKKVLMSEQQPLVWPRTANEVWSMDFAFDRTAEGCVIKCLGIADDATHESMAIVPERAIGRHQLTRILDQLRVTRGLPQVIRTDNGKEFCGRTMLTWTPERGVMPRLIEPGKPNQNAYIESHSGRLREECLNVHWFPSRAHARVVIEAWRREYNEGRSKKILGGPTPDAYAQQLAARASTMTLGL
ncbi:Transposase InsO and inactivated derivatives [Rhodanobacter sp. OK091]|nr:Transposase InsO and inactivated derivatives [Rhodanobacter sp. OK091]